jgi:hypothetical protein
MNSDASQHSSHETSQPVRPSAGAPDSLSGTIGQPTEDASRDLLFGRLLHKASPRPEAGFSGSVNHAVQVSPRQCQPHRGEAAGVFNDR